MSSDKEEAAQSQRPAPWQLYGGGGETGRGGKITIYTAPKRVVLAIVGWRYFTDVKVFHQALTEWFVEYGVRVDEVVSGGARGADTLARQWAHENGIPIKEFLPDWSMGKHAGILRNTDIIYYCTHVLAFPCKRGSGTQDSIRKARVQEKPVMEVWVGPTTLSHDQQQTQQQQQQQTQLHKEHRRGLFKFWSIK